MRHQVFRPCTTTGRRNLPKGTNVWMTLANLPQDNCFMPLPKPTGTDNAYFTIGMLLAPLSIPCKIAPNFAKFKEVTANNITLLTDMLTEFQLALVAAGKSGAVAVYPPLVLDFLAIFVTFSLMAFNLFSVDHPCVFSYDAHAPDLFCAGFPFGSLAGVLEAVFHFVSTWLTQHPSALIFCHHHLRNSQTSTLLTCFL